VPQKERAHQRLLAWGKSKCAALVAHLDIVAFVVVAALAEETVANHAVRVEHVEHRVGILLECQMVSHLRSQHVLPRITTRRTFDRLAVKTTTS
jgi:hypothetical protein